MYVLRSVLILIFVIGNAICSSISIISYDSNDVSIVANASNPCKAVRECLNCRTSRLCIPAKDKFEQVAVIACDANPAAPYCDLDTGFCTSTAPNSCQSRDFICPAVDGTYPDPSSCTKYHICVNGYRITNVCPLNNIYDHALGDCRLRRTPSDCVIQSCQGQENKDFVYAKDDRIYGSCVNGRPYLIGRCENYEKYDVNSRQCVRACRGIGNQPIPQNCRQYVRCAETSKGRYEPVVQNCPCNKGFDEGLGVCSLKAPCLTGLPDACKLNATIQQSPLPDKDNKEKTIVEPAADHQTAAFIINNSNNRNASNNVSNGNDIANGNIVNGNNNDGNSNSGDVGNSNSRSVVFIINNSGNSNGNNNVSNGDDHSNGNIVNGNDNSNNENTGNIGNSRPPGRPRYNSFIINNSDNSHGDNSVSNGDDSGNGNIVNGNGNSDNENKGDVGNSRPPGRPRYISFIINNSDNSHGDNGVSNGNDSGNGNIVNGNGNSGNENKGDIGNGRPPSRPRYYSFIINNSGNSNGNNSVSNGDDHSNGNIVNGNNNDGNSNSGGVGNSNSRSVVFIINNSGNSNGNNNVSNGDDHSNGNIVNGNDNSNNENKGNIGNSRPPGRPRYNSFIINNSDNSHGNNGVSNGNDSGNGNIVNGNGNSDNENKGDIGNGRPAGRPRYISFIINNSGNSHGNNNVSNGDDHSNGNIVNGNDNSNNENKGDVGNSRPPGRPRYNPFIINNSGNNQGDNSVSNGNDSANGNIINGNDNDNNENRGQVGIV